MRIFLSAVIILFFCAKLNGQIIPDFKSDQACLKFIHSNLKGLQDFYFDTLFSSTEIKKLNPAFKSWLRIDLNGDNKPDLFFVGAFSGSHYKPNTAMVYISKGDSYDLIPIVREGRTSFRPYVFLQKKNNQRVIIIHNYYFSGFEKVEDLLRNRELSRETCAGDDTLMYKFNSLLDYSAHPSNIPFDSLTLVKKYGWSCSVDSFIIYKNGRGRYYEGCSLVNSNIKSFQESNSNISYLKYLVQSIDLKKVQRKSIYGGTDNNSATLRIYHNGEVELFYDYGLESSFTLKAIYRYFTDIRQEL
jgi:hypothetical protein